VATLLSRHLYAPLLSQRRTLAVFVLSSTAISAGDLPAACKRFASATFRRRRWSACPQSFFWSALAAKVCIAGIRFLLVFWS
jgi:hypothetical protein